MEKCVFLGIWGLEIHIFVVNVHFFLDAGNIYQENVRFSPKVATYVGFLSDKWKDPPRVTVWLTKNRFFNGKICIFGHLGPENTHFCGKCSLFSWTRATFTRKMCVFPKSGKLCRVFKRCLKRPSAGYRMADRGRNVRKTDFSMG